MTDITNQTLRNNTYGNDEKNTNDANMELKDSTIGEFNILEQTVSDKTGDYYYRKDNSNPYLNKIISFSNGELFYVTNQGIAKYISQDTKNEILGKNGCATTITSVNIPWLSSYLKEGVIIPLSPTLITGSPLKMGQACGSEGNNVYVNTVVTSETSKYQACYADDLKHPLMTFIGGTPPELLNISASGLSSGIVNGNFTEPSISSNSYKYMNTSSGVPGWSEFNAIMANNPSIWGFATPIPNGPQFAILQYEEAHKIYHYMSQFVNFEIGDYNIRFYSCGRPNYGGLAKLSITIDNDVIYTSKEPYNYTWIETIIPFKINTMGKKKILFKVLTEGSTAIKGITIDNLKVVNKQQIQTQDGVYNNAFCKQTAIDGGYKYYALQNVNPTTQKGYCAVSNNYVGATMNGFASKVGGAVSLWESKTDIPGSIGSLTNRGSLSVINPNGAAIFNTSVGTQDSSYVGCYVENTDWFFTDKIGTPMPGKAMTYAKGNCDVNGCNAWAYTTVQCQELAMKGAYKYYGINDSGEPPTQGVCGLSNSLTETTKYGKASNCKTFTDGTHGGVYPTTNAVYSTGIGSFILTIEDDGNVTIHTGTGPYDKQELIWESKTGGKVQGANPLYTAAAGNYSKNWIVEGSTLAAGDFVGSPSGTAYLIMQTDGNLCLYTSFMKPNPCITLNDGTLGGDVGNNAIYALDEVGDKSKVTNIMYVDENSLLYSYPLQDVKLSNEFTKMTDYVVNGNDLSGTNGSCINSSIENCKTKCNSNKDCYGFTYYAKDNNGWFKGKGMNPVAASPDMKYETYVKNRSVSKEGFVGYNRPVTNISSVKLKTYDNSNYDINYKNINSLSGKTLHEDDAAVLDTENRINHLTDTINNVNVSLKNKINNLNNQSSINSSTIPVYSKKYYDIINNESIELSKSINNINGIVEDSKIVVIQKSSMFVFWCILTILMSIILIRILSMR